MNFCPGVSGCGRCGGCDGAFEKDFRAEITGKLCHERQGSVGPSDREKSIWGSENSLVSAQRCEYPGVLANAYYISDESIKFKRTGGERLRDLGECCGN